MTKYFISSDDDGHKYLVKLDRRKDFLDWVDQAYDQPYDLPPGVAVPLDGSYSGVIFENPKDSVGNDLSF